MKKRRRRRKKRGFGLVVFLLVMILLGCAGMKIYKVYGPSTEQMTEEELYGLTAGKTAVMHDYFLQETEGKLTEKEAYLPYSWVRENINPRFYWDREEALLVYALPEEILHFEEGSADEAGVPIVFREQDELWIASKLITGYTNVRIEAFPGEAVSRIYVTTADTVDETAVLRKNAVVRSRTSYKAKVIEELKKGSSIRIAPLHAGAEENPKWVRVMTEGGYTGYLPAAAIGERSEKRIDTVYRAPEYRTAADGKPVILAWHQVYNSSANKGLQGTLAGTDGITVLSPTWLSLSGNEGSFDSLSSSEYVKTAHEKGIAVWPSVTNFSDNVSLGTLLSRTSVRKRLIDGLMADAEKYGYDGINIDFELLRKEAAECYIEFIRELSVAMRARGLVLSVDVPNYEAYSGHYDRTELGNVCDYVINMGYDEHTSGDEPGSTSSEAFFRRGIYETLEQVPADKLIAGIPFYTRIWTVTNDGEVSSEAITMKGAAEWVRRHNDELTWEEENGQMVGTMKEENGHRYIWMEDVKTTENRIREIREAGLKGTAVWRLGAETADVWAVVKQSVE